MSYQGDFAPGTTVTLRRTTVATPGVAWQLTSGAAAVLRAGLTSYAVAGVNLTSNFGGVTGLNEVTINTGTDATYFAAFNDFDVILTAGTVSGVNVTGYWLGSFSLWNRAVSRSSSVQTTLANSIWNEPRSNHVTAGTFGGDAAAAPTNFSSLVIGTSGVVDANVRNMQPSAVTDFVTAPSTIETSMTVQGALRTVAAATAGQLTGAQTGTITIQGAGSASATTRIVATTTASGNRSAVVLTV